MNIIIMHEEEQLPTHLHVEHKLHYHVKEVYVEIKNIRIPCDMHHFGHISLHVNAV